MDPVALQVRATILEDFGRPPEELFAHFGSEPLASASLAQVHEARDWDGKRLAVKVGRQRVAGRGWWAKGDK